MELRRTRKGTTKESSTADDRLYRSKSNVLLTVASVSFIRAQNDQAGIDRISPNRSTRRLKCSTSIDPCSGNAESTQSRGIQFCFFFRGSANRMRNLPDSAIFFDVEAAAGIVICERAFAGRIAGASTWAHAEIASRKKRQALNSRATVEFPKDSLQRSGEVLADNDSAATENGCRTLRRRLECSLPILINIRGRDVAIRTDHRPRRNIAQLVRS